SVAAAWQASIGNVAAGSTFASLQSFGATAVMAPAAGAGLMVTGLLGVGYLGWRHYNETPPALPTAPPVPPGGQDPAFLSDAELRNAIVALGGRPEGGMATEALVTLFLTLVAERREDGAGGGGGGKEEVAEKP
ncbi:hypothetical protein T484DRAFT_1870548, partial [Baffinella frigidus]